MSARGPRARATLCALLCGPACAAPPAPEQTAAGAPVVEVPAVTPATGPPVAAAPVGPASAVTSPGLPDPPVVVGEPVVASPGPTDLPVVDEPVVADDDAPIDLEALRRRLGDGDPEAVEIVEHHPVGREALVLLRWYGARAFWARERGAGRLAATQAEVDRKIAECEVAAGIEGVCLEQAIADPYVAWAAAGQELFAWEVARVRGGVIVARARLYALTGPVTDVPHKFKVYDIDGDTRSELTVIVPVAVPDHYEGLEEEGGEVGFILEAADLRPQFSATRSYHRRSEDVGGSASEAETVWLARDVDADGHADLQVREKVRDLDIAADMDDAAHPPRTRSRKTVCPYDPAADLWRCPEALGRQLLGEPTGAGR